MKAPNFSLKSLTSNESISLLDFENKPVLLTFWVSWCPDSQRDLQLKENLYRSMNKIELQMLLIHVNGREQSDLGLNYYNKNRFTIPCIKDEGTVIYDQYQCMSVPTTFLLDSEHQIVSRFNDKAHFQDIVKSLSKVL
ncbi:TlpA family protein disulfide reductase [Evansella cellulosilytica]|uniref:Alkyl hydroperoxide reductase/ Thiol specific antioxidant/ Mal allergen n=1 Tax=Evansella cellulosilytica (strain ATCC 21833 / DSM 2522 / FERM P-1141 / JCM 9156 / N-4) TaxID=649639 RepID=E6U072_EVAC2|nr:TlpA disulfide reductase family protein [Evansella cellulosilytica]ADU30188.1 alkyl hydroperoxide reductase/ Thiol specific antioxidant/ Mal allergen [Evansella cellulosilytica DSM 2522]